jgi:hypothetical protein
VLNTAAIHMRIQGRPTTYQPVSGPERGVRAKIQDADALVRLGGDLEISNADALGFVAESDGPFEQGGEFVQGGTTYRIDLIVEARSPGLLRMDLSRMDGPGVSRQDFARGLRVMPTEVVSVAGRQFRVHVNRQGRTWEDQGLGLPVETIRIVLVCKEVDAIGMNPGDVLTLGGTDYTIASALRTGAGTVRISL